MLLPKIHTFCQSTLRNAVWCKRRALSADSWHPWILHWPFFTSLNDRLVLWFQYLTFHSASFKNSHTKKSSLKKNFISLKFNRPYVSDHLRNAVRSLSDYCKLESLHFLMCYLPHTNSSTFHSWVLSEWRRFNVLQSWKVLLTCYMYTVRKPHYCYFPQSILL